MKKGRKRGQYTQYTEKNCAEIVAFASSHTTAAAVKRYKTQFPRLNESTIRSFKQAAKNPAQPNTRPLKLGAGIDGMVQKELEKLRDAGAQIGTVIALSVANAVVKSHNKFLLKENGGHIELTKGWAKSIFKRMDWCKRRATTGKLTVPESFLRERRFRFVRGISQDVKKYNIHPKLVVNWDQTPLKLIPASPWTMTKKGSSKVRLAGVSDKRNITGLFSCTLDGDFLPYQVIYQGITGRCHPATAHPSGCHVTQNPTHWSTEETMLQYIDNILAPYIEATRKKLGEPTMPCILIYDAFRAHQVEKVVSALDRLNVLHHPVPPNLTDHLQPLDLSVNKPIKDFLKRTFSQWYCSELLSKAKDGEGFGGTGTALLKSGVLLKEMQAKWLGELFHHFQLPRQRHIVRKGFRKAGIIGAINAGPVSLNPLDY